MKDFGFFLVVSVYCLEGNLYVFYFIGCNILYFCICLKCDMIFVVVYFLMCFICSFEVEGYGNIFKI